MSEKAFIDTNVFVYAALVDANETEKRQKAVELLKSASPLVVSSQILNERTYFVSECATHSSLNMKYMRSVASAIRNTGFHQQSYVSLI